MLLRHIQEEAAAGRITGALHRVLTEGSARTRDLNGTATTAMFADAVCRALEYQPSGQ
jgi:isocitrate dehydrogenase (NAD+)